MREREKHPIERSGLKGKEIKNRTCLLKIEYSFLGLTVRTTICNFLILVPQECGSGCTHWVQPKTYLWHALENAGNFVPQQLTNEA